MASKAKKLKDFKEDNAEKLENGKPKKEHLTQAHERGESIPLALYIPETEQKENPKKKK